MKNDTNHYQKNLEAIRSLYPALAEWIEKTNPVDWITRAQSKNGTNNLLIRQANRWAPAYDMEDALKNVKEALKSIPCLYRQGVSVILGFGLGHLVNEIFQTCEQGHHVLVAEPTAHMIRLALMEYDFSKQIKDQHLVICAPSDAELVFALNVTEARKAVEYWNTLMEPYTTARPDEYAELAKTTMRTINQIRCNTGTVIGAGAQIADNGIANLPWVVRHRGVKELENLYKGKPAICVCTGPSLERNIHLLKEAQDKAIIICVGQAIRPLLAYDIKPDFATTVDFGKVNEGHFRGLMDCGVPLVCLDRTYAPLLKQWQGPKFVVGTPTAAPDESAHGVLNAKGCLDQGGSVAHMSLGLAKHLGCNPIMLVGQDLALSDRSHTRQADAAGNVSVTPEGEIAWHVKDPLCHLHDQHHSMGGVMKVPGYYGEPVMTNSGLASFINVFEILIANYKAKVINATEGGAKIKGTIPLWLDDAIVKYCKQSFPKTKHLHLFSLADNADELIKICTKSLTEDLKTFDRIIDYCRKGLKTLTGMITASRKGSHKQLRKQLDENTKWSNLAHEESQKIPLMGVAIFGAQQQIQMREMNIKQQVKVKLKENFTYEQTMEAKKKAMTKHLLSGETADLQILIKRNRHILSEAKKAAESLRKSYKQALADLKKDPAEFRQEEPIQLDKMPQFFEDGNFARPLLEARRYMKATVVETGKEASEWCKAWDLRERALEKRAEAIKEADKLRAKERKEKRHLLPMYHWHIERSREAGRAEPPKFHRALRWLKLAQKLFPNDETAQYGIATTLHHLQRYEDSICQYERLVKNYPEKSDYRFELGQVQIKAGEVNKGLKNITEAMKGTKKHDGFLPVLAQIKIDLAKKPKEKLEQTEDEQEKKKLQKQVNRLHKDALEALNLYLADSPYDYAALNKKAQCLEALGKTKDAEEIRQQLKELGVN